MVDATGGGLLVKPNSASALAEGLESLMANQKLREQLGHNGKTAIHRDFSDEKMALETLKIYKRYLTSAGILTA